MVTEIKRYSELADAERNVVHETYNNEWLMCHKKELLSKIPKTLRKTHSEFRKELLRQCLKESAEQWESTSIIFEEGQNVLLEDKKVAYHIRSNTPFIPDFPMLSECERSKVENYPAELLANFKYPHTWYLASDSGKIKKSHSPKGNLWLNFAVTRNREVEAKGGLEKLLRHQLQLARERDMCSHTFTPLNGYPHPPAPEINEDEVEEHLVEAFRGNIVSPAGIHTYIMAKNKFGERAKPKEDDPEILDYRRSRILYVFPNARIKDDAKGLCCVTAYTGFGTEVEPGWSRKFMKA